MGVLLQAAYRRAQEVSVPSPADGDHTVAWWWDLVPTYDDRVDVYGLA